MSRDQRQYVAQEFNVPQAMPARERQRTITQKDVDDARASTATYIVKDLKQVRRALEAKATRASEESADAYEFAIALVQSVIDSHE